MRRSSAGPPPALGLGCRRRAAFTLIELLVVIAIIGILMSLTAGAVVVFINVQRENNTKSALSKFKTALDSQWRTEIGKANKEPLDPYALQLAGNDAMRARVITIKMRLTQAFPMSFDEVKGVTLPGLGASSDYPNGLQLPRQPGYQAYLGGLGIQGSGTANDTLPYESSACLLMALQRPASGQGVTTEALGGGATKLYTLPNGQSFPYLVDGWGNPVAFCRWPTGSPALVPTVGNNVYKDPTDPQGLLNNPGWRKDWQTAFESAFHPLPDPKQPRTLVPLIASPGRDAKLGLDPNTFAPADGTAADNVYSPEQQ